MKRVIILTWKKKVSLGDLYLKGQVGNELVLPITQVITGHRLYFPCIGGNLTVVDYILNDAPFVCATCKHAYEIKLVECREGFGVTLPKCRGPQCGHKKGPVTAKLILEHDFNGIAQQFEKVFLLVATIRYNENKTIRTHSVSIIGPFVRGTIVKSEKFYVHCPGFYMGVRVVSTCTPCRNKCSPLTVHDFQQGRDSCTLSLTVNCVGDHLQVAKHFSLAIQMSTGDMYSDIVPFSEVRSHYSGGGSHVIYDFMLNPLLSNNLSCAQLDVVDPDNTLLAFLRFHNSGVSHTVHQDFGWRLIYQEKVNCDSDYFKILPHYGIREKRDISLSEFAVLGIPWVPWASSNNL